MGRRRFQWGSNGSFSSGNRAMGAGRERSQRRRGVSVLSLAPGSGGTFVTLMLARLLGEMGVPVQAIEGPGGHPQWHALLGIGGDPAEPDGPDRVIGSFARELFSGSIARPITEVPQQRMGTPRFRLMAGEARDRVTLVDWSSRWEDGAAGAWLRSSGLVIVCADPDPSRWTESRLRSIGRLMEERG